LNICMVYWFYPPIVGGVEVYLETLGRYLARKGIRIELLTGPVKGARKTQSFGKLTVRRIPSLNSHGKENPQKRGSELMKYIQELIQERDISIVSVQNFHNDVYPAHTFAVNSACINTETPLVNTLHNPCKTRLDRALLANLMWSKLIGVTKNMTEHIYQAGVPIEKICCVYNGISLKRFRPGKSGWLHNKFHIKERDHVIICPTRIISTDKGEPLFERKGLITLLKAVSVASQTKRNIKLIITGAPPNPLFVQEYRDAIKKLRDTARLYGIGNKLVITEGIKSRHMPALYNDSDMMVLAAKNEPFGLAYIEAMACELPVIGASTGGVPEIIQNDVNGYLTPTDDHVELAKRIIWLLKDRKRMERFGKAGRRIAIQKFSLKRMAEETMKVYESVIK
jgi:glycosyltransferase involved in cell wall biosynthesis